MAIKIAFFNHKGGVSKTTSVYNVGWMLTQKGKKVLLVDADSQCNLTLTVIGEDEYENFKNQSGDDLKTALAPAFESRPELIKPVDCLNVKNNADLFLLPGSFEITEYEVQLGVSFQLSNSFSTMKNLPGSFNFLIEKTAERYNIDFILIDVNPSLSAINQVLLISSDYFIVPTSPDYFSKMAIRSLSRILPAWERWAKQARDLFSDSTYPLPHNTPKFLGYTVNDFTIKYGEPAQAFQNIINSINQLINEEMIPSLKKAGMLLEESAYADHEYCLAKISNFHTLQAKSQEFGVPVYQLTNQQIGATGPVLKTQQDNREKFKALFSNFADKIINMIPND
ncbi:MAG: putative ATPase involved in chromosome partitioning [Adhaeribacter sp.]|nr:putative ATPase involved in chromosome partitioning [Adhaeribacter sp.]